MASWSFWHKRNGLDHCLLLYILGDGRLGAAWVETMQQGQKHYHRCLSRCASENPLVGRDGLCPF